MKIDRNCRVVSVACMLVAMLACSRSQSELTLDSESVQNSHSERSGNHSDSLRAALDARLAENFGGDQPGIAVMVTRADTARGLYTWGKANWEFAQDWTESTRYTFYSLTKAMVVLALQELEREGALSLEDDVREYLTDLPDFGEIITLRHMTTHTSGLYQDEIMAYLAGVGIGDESLSLDELYELALRQRQLSHKPGTYFSYSDTAMRLLARVIEIATGENFSKAMKRLVFDPAGMETAYVAGLEPLRSRERASTYELYSSANSAQPALYRVRGVAMESSGDCGVVGTPRDMLAYLLYLRSQSPDGQRRIESLAAPVEYRPGLSGAYRSSVQVDTYRGMIRYSHGGLYGKLWNYLPALDLGVAIITNNLDVQRGDTMNTVLDTVLEIDFAEGQTLEDAFPRDPVMLRLADPDHRSVLSGAYLEPKSGVPVVFDLGGKGAAGRIFNQRFTLFNAQSGIYRTSMHDTVVAEWHITSDETPLLMMRQADWTEFRALLPITKTTAEVESKHLSRYSGAYYSDEFGMFYHISACGSGLQLEIGSSIRETYRIALAPIADHYFASVPGAVTAMNGLDATMTVKFQIDDEHATSGLEVNMDSVRGLRLRALPLHEARVPIRTCRVNPQAYLDTVSERDG